MPHTTPIATIFGNNLTAVLEENANHSAVEGPFPFKSSTESLQKLVNIMLDEGSSVTFNHSHINGHLIARCFDANRKKFSIDLSKILENNPNFSHIQLDSNQLDQFIKWVSQHTNEVRPQAINPEFYQRREQQEGISSTPLHLAEKIAINIYTTSYFKHMNELLRGNGVKALSLWSGLTDEALQVRAKTALLASVVAALGINLMINPPSVTGKNTPFNTIRYENGSSMPGQVLGARYIAKSQHKPHYEKGFFSCSYQVFDTAAISDQTRDVYTIMMQNKAEDSLGKLISVYSQNPEDENEVLFPPGTQFKVLGGVAENNNKFFWMTPMRSVVAEEVSAGFDVEEATDMDCGM